MAGPAAAFVIVIGGNFRMPRFTIKNLLTATFWACVWGTVLINYKWLDNSDSNWMLLVLVPVWLFIFAGPFIVIGSAFGRAYRGLKIGMCVAITITALMFALALVVVS
jgi:hypothetical protein